MSQNTLLKLPVYGLTVVLGFGWISVHAMTLLAPTFAHAQESKKPAKKRVVKKVKALSLVAQGYVIKVTRIFGEATKLGERASNILASAEQAKKDIVVWQEEIKAGDLSTKKVAKLRAQIEDAEKLIASAPKTSEALNAASLKLVGRALPVLDTMRANIGKLQSQDRAAMWNYYGYIYSLQENYRGARRAYDNLLKESEVAPNLRLQAMFSSGQLSMVLEEYQKGVKRLEQWYAYARELEKPIRPGDHFLLAQGYYALSEYDKVIVRINDAIELALSKAIPLREGWLRLLVATYFVKENFTAAREPLEALVLLFPKREYWIQLQGTYGELELRENQLAILDLAWRQGLLERSSEFVALSQHLQLAGDPLQAALVLTDGIDQEIVEEDFDKLSLLANYWLRAQEIKKALESFEKASEETDSGKMHFRMAQILFLENQIEEAYKAAEIAYKRGGIDDLESVRILMAQSLLELGEYEQALEIFNDIASESEKAKSRVKSWLKYAATQQDAIDAMNAAIDVYKAQEREILSSLELR
ncbi:MAG: CDC27 family protein [Gammaproteobacteria bacterium]